MPQKFSPNALLAEERPLTTEEFNIATRICLAYQSKSFNFRSNNFLGTQFQFASRKTDCQNNTINYNVAATLAYDENNQLVLNPPGALDPNFRFFKKVQTDSSGYLAQLCPKVVNHQPISNTTTVNNIKTQILFTVDDPHDSYQLTYFSRRADGVYKMDSAETFKVRTQFKFVSGQILGMDEIYSTQKNCSDFDKARSSDFQQTFTSR